MNRIRDVLDRWRCQHVRRVLQSYLDGELDGLDAAEVAAHLAACQRCGMEAAQLRAVSAVVAGLAIRPDPGSLRRLRELVDQLGQAR